jgi:hypothetical protein
LSPRRRFVEGVAPNPQRSESIEPRIRLAGSQSAAPCRQDKRHARRTGKLGTHATPEQWHRGNPDIAEAAKDRFRNFIAEKLKLSAPSADDERADPSRSNDFYLSAGNWLREHTRDTRTYAILWRKHNIWLSP